jgi:hypothetical protein
MIRKRKAAMQRKKRTMRSYESLIGADWQPVVKV